MTLDEAIEHAEEVADKKEREKQKWERWLETDSDYRAVVEKVSCELCAEEHRQLAEWLKELKAYRERMPSYEAGYNDAKREIALSGEYKRAYDRGYEQACKDKIDIPCKEGNDEDSN